MLMPYGNGVVTFLMKQRDQLLYLARHYPITILTSLFVRKNYVFGAGGSSLEALFIWIKISVLTNGATHYHYGATVFDG